MRWTEKINNMKGEIDDIKSILVDIKKSVENKAVSNL